MSHDLPPATQNADAASDGSLARAIGSRRASAILPATPDGSGNRIIASLPPQEQKRLAEAADLVALRSGSTLSEAGGRIDHVYFPLGAVIALQAPVVDEATLQVGLVGPEGVFGSILMEGVPLSPVRAEVRLSGSSLRLGISELRYECARSQELRLSLGRYLQSMIAQMAQLAACTRSHGLEQRLSRWLLATHDRVRGDVFRLKQQTLADMLGVQRSGVSLIAAQLRHRRLIEYSRGVITIIDRAGLERAACACYAWQRDLQHGAFVEPQRTPLSPL